MSVAGREGAGIVEQDGEGPIGARPRLLEAHNEPIVQLLTLRDDEEPGGEVLCPDVLQEDGLVCRHGKLFLDGVALFDGPEGEVDKSSRGQHDDGEADPHQRANRESAAQ